MKKIKCKNPVFTDLKKSNSKRYGKPSDFKKIVKNGVEHCAWCGEGKVRGNQKYCTPECKDNCYAFAGPQSEWGLEYHLQSQDFKCIGCNFDYKPHLDHLNKKYSQKKYVGYTEDGQACPRLFDRLKWRIEVVEGKDKKPEVDHIVPIALGGESIGFDNHQVLCHNCHKEKTKTDISEIAKTRKDSEQQA